LERKQVPPVGELVKVIREELDLGLDVELLQALVQLVKTTAESTS
jgi:hypothetical protein